MTDSYLLKRVLSVCIHPGIVLLDSLREMTKVSVSAELIVKEKKIQFLATLPEFGGAYAMLDMDSLSIVDPSNSDRYCLLLHLNNLLQRLEHYLQQLPSTVLHLTKEPGSNNLGCYLGDIRKTVELGKAQFVQTEGMMTGGNPFKVRVTMHSEYFRTFIENFARTHDHSISALRLGISREFLRWISQAGGRPFRRVVQGCLIEGLEQGTEIQFRVRWNWTLFSMLCSVSTRYDQVVLSVFHDSLEMEWYQFRFNKTGQTYTFCYLETTARPRERLEVVKL